MLGSMRTHILAVLLSACLVAAKADQPAKPFQAQSSSSIALSVKGDESAINITNITYEIAWPDVPGKPTDEALVLRKTLRQKQVLGDMGQEATMAVEAWPMGTDLKQKPRYSFSVTGTECQTVENALLVVSRGLEEVDWWSAYKLGSGAHLFDTYVPLVKFSISRETLKMRYAGLEVPPDDTRDQRLKKPNVVAVVTYASGDRVIREALITADDPKKAALLRSFADETRELSGGGRESAAALKISFSQNYPSAPATQTVTIPVLHDDLDLAHAELPAHVHIAAWKR